MIFNAFSYGPNGRQDFFRDFGKGKPFADSLGLPFHKEPVQKYKEASAIFKYSPSLSVLFRYNCLLMFQLLSLFLSLFHGREISEARNFGARSIPNLATNSEVNFLRSEEPPVTGICQESMAFLVPQFG